jgi:hypothetical protein
VKESLEAQVPSGFSTILLRIIRVCHPWFPSTQEARHGIFPTV